MRLRDFLASVASTYDRHAPMDAPAQQFLKDAPCALADSCRLSVLAPRLGKVLVGFVPYEVRFCGRERWNHRAGWRMIGLASGRTALSHDEGLSGPAGDRPSRDEGLGWWVAVVPACRARFADVLGADLRSLAALRVVLALVAFMDLAGRASSLRALYTDEGAYPRQLLLGNLNEWQWSVFLTTGSVALVRLLFVAAVVAALGLLLGYRTQLLTLIVWVMIVSIQLRNPLLLNAGDTLLRLLLFWGIFLPLGARWSIDAKRASGRARAAAQYFSAATVGLPLQIAFIYWFTAALKTGRPWREDGTALYYSLGLAELSRPFGQFLHQFPDLLKVLTFATLGLEVVAPILLFVPIFTAPIRTAAAFSLMALQAGIYLTLSIGFFPWLSSLCMVCFLPGWFWDNALPWLRTRIPGRSYIAAIGSRVLGARAPAAHLLKPRLATGLLAQQRWENAPVSDGGIATADRVRPLDDSPAPTTAAPVNPARPERSRAPLAACWSLLGNAFAAICLVTIFGWNMTTVSGFTMPRDTIPFREVLNLDQRWDMFAPEPPHASTWHVMTGVLQDGRLVDLLTPIMDDDLDRVAPVSMALPDGHAYKDESWRRYLLRITTVGNDAALQSFDSYVCSEWNGRHSGPAQLLVYQLSVMTSQTLPGDRRGPALQQVIVTSTCS